MKKPGWNDIESGNLLIRPQDVFGNPSKSNLVAKQEELAKKMMIIFFSFEASISYFKGVF
jgi:hypothetical protein